MNAFFYAFLFAFLCIQPCLSQVAPTKATPKPTPKATSTPLSNQQIFENKMKVGKHNSLTICFFQTAKSLLGTTAPKLVSNTELLANPDLIELQGNFSEDLVVNLKVLDCQSLVENALALAQTRHNPTPNFENFKNNLRELRYRNGRVECATRLHYFTDWLFENEKRGILTQITRDLGGQKFDKQVFYMSQKRDTLFGCMASPVTFRLIREREMEISQRAKWFIPKDSVAKVESLLQDGDIIAITNKTEGMDIAHVGIACWHNGRVHLLHASSDKQKVVISELNLVDYLADHRKQTGIMVARVNAEAIKN
jgi:Protein of unknown function (DUF1460)